VNSEPYLRISKSTKFKDSTDKYLDRIQTETYSKIITSSRINDFIADRQRHFNTNPNIIHYMRLI
jgi:hypothetical protein